MAKEKERLDVLVVSRGLAPSREKAKALIMAGDVFVNGQREDKPGTTFEEDKITSLEVKGATIPYVSRGGLKLEKAVNNFGLDLSGKVCMDIGSLEVMTEWSAWKRPTSDIWSGTISRTIWILPPAMFLLSHLPRYCFLQGAFLRTAAKWYAL